MSDNVEKTYTQAQVDDIMAKVKSNADNRVNELQARYDALSKEHNAISGEYQTLKNGLRADEIKATFLNHNGNATSFNDFMKSNPDLMNLSGDELKKTMNNLRESKPYFFNQVTPQYSKSEESFLKGAFEYSNKERPKDSLGDPYLDALRKQGRY